MSAFAGRATDAKMRLTSVARRLVQPCTLRTAEMERHATWLELFYDLVFVVVVAELGRRLLDDLSPLGVGIFIGVWVPVWWAWFHHTIYSDRLDPDDPAHRVLTFAQMFFIGLLVLQRRLLPSRLGAPMVALGRGGARSAAVHRGGPANEGAAT